MVRHEKSPAKTAEFTRENTKNALFLDCELQCHGIRVSGDFLIFLELFGELFGAGRGATTSPMAAMEGQLLTGVVLVGVDSDKVYVAIKVCYFFSPKH